MISSKYNQLTVYNHSQNLARHFCNVAFLTLFLLLSACGHKGHTHSEDEEENHSSHSGVRISEETVKEFGIVTETAIPEKFHDVIKTSGTIEPSASSSYTLTAKKRGVVTLSPAISEGASVKAGETIARISADGIEGGDAGKVALANLDAARKEYERLKPLYEEGLVTASTFREAERAYNEAKAIAGNQPESRGATVVVTPKAGTLSSLNVRSGDFVEAGSPIGIVAENSSRILKADLPAREATHLGHIQDANVMTESRQLIRLSEVEGKKLSGGSASIAKNGYIPVYFSFSANEFSAPGGYAEVYLLCQPREGVISIPREALIETQGNKYIYVMMEKGTFEKRLVETGASDGARVEILEGLRPGEKFVAKGASVVRMAEISATPPPSHSHTH